MIAITPHTFCLSFMSLNTKTPFEESVDCFVHTSGHSHRTVNQKSLRGSDSFIKSRRVAKFLSCYYNLLRNQMEQSSLHKFCNLSENNG